MVSHRYVRDGPTLVPTSLQDGPDSPHIGDVIAACSERSKDGLWSCSYGSQLVGQHRSDMRAGLNGRSSPAEILGAALEGLPTGLFDGASALNVTGRKGAIQYNVHCRDPTTTFAKCVSILSSNN